VLSDTLQVLGIRLRKRLAVEGQAAAENRPKENSKCTHYRVPKNRKFSGNEFNEFLVSIGRFHSFPSGGYATSSSHFHKDSTS
jgi:hypothetical protein